MQNGFLLIVLIFLASSCVTTPTGRSQLNLISEKQMKEIGGQAFTAMKAKLPVERGALVNNYVQCVAKALLAVADDASDKWEIVVFEDKMANAFALPGGKIGVHRGLFKVATDQNELATVLGHEIGHVLARHGNERVSQTILAQGGLEIVGNVLEDARSKGIILGALGLGAQYGVLYPHSRKQEAEADEMGLMLMAKAGFDPRRAVDLWHNMAKINGGQPPEFLSTHPSHASRIERLTALQERARSFAASAVREGRKPRCLSHTEAATQGNFSKEQRRK